MIRISKLTDYAVIILNALANRNEELSSASALAQTTTLPEPTVCKIMKILNKADIVTSMRGVNGGYGLQRDMNEISIAEIISAIEGPIALTACVDASNDICAMENICAMKARWRDVNGTIQQALDNIKLSDMVQPELFMDNIVTTKEKSFGTSVREGKKA